MIYELNNQSAKVIANNNQLQFENVTIAEDLI